MTTPTLSRPSGVQAPCHSLYAHTHDGATPRLPRPFPRWTYTRPSALATVNCQWTRG